MFDHEENINLFLQQMGFTAKLGPLPGGTNWKFVVVDHMGLQKMAVLLSNQGILGMQIYLATFQKRMLLHFSVVF